MVEKHKPNSQIKNDELDFKAELRNLSVYRAKFTKI